MEYILLIGIVFLLFVFFTQKEKQNNTKYNTTQYAKKYSPPNPIEITINEEKTSQDYYKEQINILNKCNFEPKKALNKPEQLLYWKLIYNIPKDKKIKILVQVNLGEILNCYQGDGFSYINSKRVDFCLLDKDFMPIVVIEYNGTGHFKDNYKLRDEIKKIACKKAGITFLSITYKDNFDDFIANEVLQKLI